MARMEVVGRQQMRNGLDDNFRRQVEPTIQHVVETRRRTIKVLREKARLADEIHRGCSASNRNANITGAIGGVVGMIGGGITTIDNSEGLAAPIAFAVGGACSVGGGAWLLKNKYDRDKRNETLRQELLKVLVEDTEALGELREIIERIEGAEFGEPSKILRELHILLAGFGSIGMIIGSTAALDLFQEALPAVAYMLSGGTSKILLGLMPYLPKIAAKISALETTEEIADKIASSAVRYMYNGLSKDIARRETTIAAQKAYQEFLQNDAQKAALQVVDEGGNLVAQQTASQAAKEAAEEVAKELAKESAKTAAKVTGMVTMGFGVLTSLWEGYNAYYNHCESKKESKFGHELHDLATKLENRLNLLY